MAQNPNQFVQSPEKGQNDLTINPSVFSVQVDAAQATALVPGQLVKMSTTAGGVPKVIASAAVGDDHFGVVVFNRKTSSFPALSMMEVAAWGSVVYMEASAAITRGAAVAFAASGLKVATAVSTNTIVGRALDTASGDGSLVRVYLSTGLAEQILA